MTRIARTFRLTGRVLIVLALAAGCASRSRSGAVTGNTTLITEAEVARYGDEGVRDLRELIERIRPLWLQSRGERSFTLETMILVYHNSQAIGGIEALRDFPLTNVRSIRYLDAAQAGQLPGASGRHVEAAIVISTSSR